jgi:hypothetical protein
MRLVLILAKEASPTKSQKFLLLFWPGILHDPCLRRPVPKSPKGSTRAEREPSEPTSHEVVRLKMPGGGM